MPSIKNYEIFFVLVLTYNEGTSVNGREPFFVKVRHVSEKFQRIHLSDLDNSYVKGKCLEVKHREGTLLFVWC